MSAGILDKPQGGETERTATERDRQLRIMNYTGDLTITFDPTNEAEAEVADKAFKAARKAGMLAYKVVAQTNEVTQSLDATDPEGAPLTVLSSPLVGG